eukprot:SAG11_NODE_1383_length_5074_cov_41.695276_5_plen_95_part_00
MHTESRVVGPIAGADGVPAAAAMGRGEPAPVDTHRTSGRWYASLLGRQWAAWQTEFELLAAFTILAARRTASRAAERDWASWARAGRESATEIA